LFTCQPTPLLRTEGGIGVALAYLDTAMKAPVDCGTRNTRVLDATKAFARRH